MDIDGSIAVVTGASSGIGRATGIALARAGATVAGIARRADALADSIELFRVHAPGSIAVVGDLSSRDGCEQAIRGVISALGRVDVLVNNAGISMRRTAAHTTADDVERIMAINFSAAVYATAVALPGMLERKRGSIVNITSVAGTVPNPQESAYAASKAALSMWTHTLAVDLHSSGVHVGAVSPGPIDTEIWSYHENPAAYRGRKYPPEMVAGAVVRSIRSERVFVTVPRRFGLPGVLYPWFGRPMRWGLRRYDRRERRSRTTAPSP